MVLRSRPTLSLFMLFAALTAPLSAHAGDQGPKGTAPAGPMLWAAYIENTDRFTQNTPGPIVPSIISSFTPSNEITIVRIQAEAYEGPFFGSSHGPLSQNCPIRPQIQVTNGGLTQTLVFAQTEIFQGPSSTDSGTINLDFPANTRIRLMFLPGSPNIPDTGYCAMYGINVTLQYKTR